MTVRKPLYALGLLSLTTLLTVGLASPAGAAQTCGPFADPSTPPSCFSTSTDTVTVEQPVEGTTDNIETFKTRVIVQTADGTTFDRTVDAPSESPDAADLVAAAEAAAIADGLQVAGTASSPPQRELADSTSSDVTTPDREEVSVQTEFTIGPATAQVGPERSEPLFVPSGATLVNSNTRTTFYVNVTTNTTNTYLTTATITITAVAPAVATTSTPTTSTTVAPAVAPASTDTSSGELARTGTSTGPWTAAGISFVLAGAACLYLSRRSAQRSAT